MRVLLAISATAIKALDPPEPPMLIVAAANSAPACHLPLGSDQVLNRPEHKYDYRPGRSSRDSGIA